MTEYVPCPECSSTKAKKVSYTWWGGMLGPSMFTHVKCPDCGTAYNGKTGKSNNVAIAIYVGVSVLVGIGIAALFWLK